MKPTNLTNVYQRKLLRLIEEAPRSTQEASDILGIAYTTTNRYMNVLMGRGQIHVSHTAKHRRVYGFGDKTPEAPVKSKRPAKSQMLPVTVVVKDDSEEMPTDGRIMTRWVGGNPFKKAMA